MAVLKHWTKSLAALAMLATASTAIAEGTVPLGTPAAVDPVRMPPAVTAAPNVLPQPAAVSRPPVAAPGQFPSRPLRQTTLTASPVRHLPPVKPFQAEYQRPTISPYLQLHRASLDESLPNYFAFVLPQIHQQELLQEQQEELQQIQLRLQQTARQVAPAVAARGESAQPTNYHARFLNTGGYFSGVTSHLPSIDANP